MKPALHLILGGLLVPGVVLLLGGWPFGVVLSGRAAEPALGGLCGSPR